MFSKKDTDLDWEKFGNLDPYYGVLAQDRFRKENLTKGIKKEFFESGYNYIDSMIEKIHKYIDPDFLPEKVLDFGCGVGRLVIPLAERAKVVHGMDVSESMLLEAQNNCNQRTVKNALFMKADDELTKLTGKYDFIHSFIVFQHIPVKRGEKIFEKLLDHLSDGGVFVSHFTYARSKGNSTISSFVKRRIPFGKEFINLIRGRKISSPHMQMNLYNINNLLKIIQKGNRGSFYAELTDHGGEYGVILYFQK